MAIVLASASPRRKELLAHITEDFEVMTSAADETLPPKIAPRDAVMLLAEKKAEWVAKELPEKTVIGSDTVVAVDDAILGKPADDDDARRMLRLLSGREHEVYTGVCVIKGGRREIFFDMAKVKFAAMTDNEINHYVASGECNDKAGAYAIQGLGARYIEYISGDYYSVVGLPVRKLYKTLSDMQEL